MFFLNEPTLVSTMHPANDTFAKGQGGCIRWKPRCFKGQNFQCWTFCMNVTVANKYTLSSLDTTKYLYPENQEDSINFGFTDGITARDTGQCGIGISDGTNQLLDGNKA
jgi:hypothetical protein